MQNSIWIKITQNSSEKLAQYCIFKREVFSCLWSIEQQQRVRVIEQIALVVFSASFVAAACAGGKQRLPEWRGRREQRAQFPRDCSANSGRSVCRALQWGRGGAFAEARPRECEQPLSEGSHRACGLLHRRRAHSRRICCSRRRGHSWHFEFRNLHNMCRSFDR